MRVQEGAVGSVSEGPNPEVWCKCNRPLTPDMGGTCDFCRAMAEAKQLTERAKRATFPKLPPEYRRLWDGALARLETLHGLKASAADIYAAREYRNDVCTQICDYFLGHWDTLNAEEREGVELIMGNLPRARETAKAAFEEAKNNFQFPS